MENSNKVSPLRTALYALGGAALGSTVAGSKGCVALIEKATSNLSDSVTSKFVQKVTVPKDDYVRSRIMNSIDKVQTLPRKKWAATYGKIAEKANLDYTKLSEKLFSEARPNVSKYISKGIVGLIATGCAIVGIKLASNLVNKANKQQENGLKSTTA